MVPAEPLYQTETVGARYRAAGGQSLVNHGEKCIEFMTRENAGKLFFQAIPKVKPLASAARIANNGNTIVLDEEGGDSYIYNKVTEKTIPIRQVNHVYVLDVEYMTEDKDEYGEVPFQRQA